MEPDVTEQSSGAVAGSRNEQDDESPFPVAAEDQAQTTAPPAEQEKALTSAESADPCQERKTHASVCEAGSVQDVDSSPRGQLILRGVAFAMTFTSGV